MKRNLDHQLWKFILKYNLKDKKIGIALSGGLDSVALLVSLSKVHKDIQAFHFHHGPTSSRPQKKYRDQAVVFCQKLCAKIKVPLEVLASTEKSGASEADLRKLRYGAFGKFMSDNQIDVLMLAHHADDLLETRLLRLIRGTGAQGLEAMKECDGNFARPFLMISKQDLKLYLKGEKVKFLEDPSNESIDPLRNWLRKTWLSPLEKRQKGASQSLARSLEALVQEVSGQKSLLSEAFSSQGLSRAYYLTLTEADQQRLLAQYLYRLGKRDFSQSHIKEIQKRLDSSQKEHSFRVASCDWNVNAQQIKIES